MNDFSGKVAVVTGAASGIGLALATRFAQEGMKLVLSDIEAAPLEAARAALAAQGAQAIAIGTDVSREEDVKRLADAAFGTWGDVHVLCNNAGVSGGFGADGVWNVAREDWEWVLGVNFSGVLYGIRQFVPRMLARGQAGHIVNTASVAGLITSGTGAAYTVSKHAVTALTELLYKDLKARSAKLSASVLCPGWVDTRILDSARNRPEELKPAAAAQATPEQLLRLAAVRGFLKSGFRPEAIAGLVVDAIRSDAFYIVPAQPEIEQALARRLEDIRQRRNPTLT
ncbi:MAG TPA: SDR family NAD(P)-dependent oxidoreductase [Burkholderiales bacterium]|nr:SDR family NAD(P)-dependent oxidoreductase [Burkholderiales bacterium]